jgi:hypothetical protein
VARGAERPLSASACPMGVVDTSEHAPARVGSRTRTDLCHEDTFRMKHLYEAAVVDEVRERIGRMRPDSQPLWGRMNAAQALAHLALAMESALGDTKLPRHLLGHRERGRLLGTIERFARGPAACTPHPHFFFGPMPPVEWASFMYVHLDHRLRQFQV